MSLHCDSIPFILIYSHSDLKKKKKQNTKQNRKTQHTKVGWFFFKHQSGLTVSVCLLRDSNKRLWHRKEPRRAKSLMCRAFTWDGGAMCSRPTLNQRGEDLGCLPHVPHMCSHHLAIHYHCPAPSQNNFFGKCFWLVPRWNESGVW